MTNKWYDDSLHSLITNKVQSIIFHKNLHDSLTYEDIEDITSDVSLAVFEHGSKLSFNTTNDAKNYLLANIKHKCFLHALIDRHTNRFIFQKQRQVRVYDERSYAEFCINKAVKDNNRINKRRITPAQPVVITNVIEYLNTLLQRSREND